MTQPQPQQGIDDNNNNNNHNHKETHDNTKKSTQESFQQHDQQQSDNELIDPSKLLLSSTVANGNEMRRIDLQVSDILSIIRVQEVASTRLADFLLYHLDFYKYDNNDNENDNDTSNNNNNNDNKSNSNMSKKRNMDKNIVFVVGKGNNGANGIAAARHLIGRGWGRQKQTSIKTTTTTTINNVSPHTTTTGGGTITVLLAFPREEMGEMSQEQLKLYEYFGGQTMLWSDLFATATTISSSASSFSASSAAKIFKQQFATTMNTDNTTNNINNNNHHYNNCIIVDGLLGTGISKPPRGIIKDMIECINETKLPVVALDVPSGLNHETGELLQPCIRATWTFNFHVLKSGQVLAAAARTNEAAAANNNNNNDDDGNVVVDVIGELWTADTDLTYIVWDNNDNEDNDNDDNENDSNEIGGEGLENNNKKKKNKTAGVSVEALQELYSIGPIRRVF